MYSSRFSRSGPIKIVVTPPERPINQQCACKTALKVKVFGDGRDSITRILLLFSKNLWYEKYNAEEKRWVQRTEKLSETDIPLMFSSCIS